MAMTTTSGDFRLTGSEREHSALHRLMSRIITARQRQAERAINAYLLSLDDKSLEQLGYERKSLEKNASGSYPFL
ncbi:hypothetical protein [Amorphus orientalis]|uniref:Uncharacterized protein n=1 Tax=Amorphus orientalis TaxID=649198 RepID=A0AAE4ASM4_9HYPH|nr:hypothetical protein [Amorphus orientalis]MDQ0315267.1 hypothetical protein [Amorphus orientalis]